MLSKLKSPFVKNVKLLAGQKRNKEDIEAKNWIDFSDRRMAELHLEVKRMADVTPYKSMPYQTINKIEHRYKLMTKQLQEQFADCWIELYLLEHI